MKKIIKLKNIVTKAWEVKLNSCKEKPPKLKNNITKKIDKKKKKNRSNLIDSIKFLNKLKKKKKILKKNTEIFSILFWNKIITIIKNKTIRKKLKKILKNKKLVNLKIL